MATIDRSSQTTPAVDPVQLTGSGSRHRQTWLKALEEAGLRDALRATRQFVSTGTSFSATDGRATSDLPARPGSGDRFGDDGIQSGNRNASPAPADNDGSFLAPARTRQAAVKPAALREFNPAAGVQPTGRAMSDRDAAPVPARHSAPAAVLQRIWQSRNVAVLPSGQGVEVWIRDAALTQSGLATWLAGLRGSMAELGASLVRVSLNGKPVYSLAQRNPGEPKPKEG